MQENASIFQYWFEVNGKMKKGVIAEKEEARIAYEETVRKQVDPSLLIWTKGNNFKTRIYPINAKSTKRIIVSYQEELSPSFDKNCKNNCLSYYYSLPLNLKYKISEFSLKVKANKVDIIPISKEKNRFIKSKNELVLYDENYMPNENIKLKILPKKFENKNIINTSYNNTSIKSATEKNWYFSATVFPKKVNLKKEKPKRICLYWDSSISMKNRNLKKELDFLNAYVGYLKKVNISLINISNNENIIGKFNNKNKLSAKLVKFIKNTIYDGGTQLGVINTKKTLNACSEALIFTDGISNFGKENPILSIPTYFINSKVTAEHSHMKFLSNKSGGSYINLQNTNISNALNIIKTQEFQFINASYQKKDIIEIWPNTPLKVKNNGSFTITGISAKKDNKIALNFGIGNKIYKKIVINILAKDKKENKIVERLFARKKISELLKQKEKNMEQIIEVSKQYSILTEFTSFLVLESLNDYLLHRIVPPKEMQKEYYDFLKNEKKEEEKEKQEVRNEQIENLLIKLNELSQWWSKKHVSQEEKDEEKRKREEELKRMEKEGIAAIGSTGYGYGSGGVSKGGGRGGHIILMHGRSGAKSNTPQDDYEEEKEMEKADNTINIKEYNPDTPYLRALKKAKKDHYKLYLKLRKNYENSSSFYLDVSDFFMKKHKKNLALKILSNIAEMELENHELLRILGYRLWQFKKFELATYTFKKVLEMRPEEPQSYRDLGLTYRNMKKYKKAVEYLYKVAITEWDDRFSDIDLIALYEMNAIIINKCDNKKRCLPNNVDKRLIKNLPVDIRVVLSWDANDTDIDLWVTDPYGVKSYYAEQKTEIGGLTSKDFTGGYGPEMFILRNAHKGKYKIQADYYGSSNQELSGEITLHLELFLNYGKKNQVKKDIVVRVKSKKDVIDIGEFEIK